MLIPTFAELSVTKDGFLLDRSYTSDRPDHYLFGESGHKRLLHDMSKLLREKEDIQLGRPGSRKDNKE